MVFYAEEIASAPPICRFAGRAFFVSMEHLTFNLARAMIRRDLARTREPPSTPFIPRAPKRRTYDGKMRWI